MITKLGKQVIGKTEYPLDTHEQARIALRTVTAKGTDKEKEKVRNAVRSKFPYMRVRGCA